MEYRKYKLIFVLYVIIYAIFFRTEVGYTMQTLSLDEMHAIGKKIWKNESNCSFTGLAHWHVHEQFPSFGIGHFIWLTQDNEKNFTQTFPELIDFMYKKGTDVPKWLIAKRTCPWKHRTEFINDAHSPRMLELLNFLYATINQQAEFIIIRLERALSLVINGSAAHDRDRVTRQIALMQQSPMGMFVIIDYHNFKGDGTNPHERYAGRGWGLIQVFAHMHNTITPEETLKEFIAAAQKVLEERVKNKPQEITFLTGWINRLMSYKNP